MRIAIFGLGYVGSVSAACLASAGHEVFGVDVDPHKIEVLRQGRSPIREPGLESLISQAVSGGRLHVTTSTAQALAGADLSLVCVGTPSRRNGSLDLQFLERAFEEIGSALASLSPYHVIAVRSTLLPGALAARLLPLLESASGRRVGDSIGLCVNPEFLREGSAIVDFNHPPFTLIGETDVQAGDVLLSAYRHIDAPVHRVLPDEASMVKYASNMFHALKVAFANEVGAVSRAAGIDGERVMRVFCQDRELNISHRYLRPGFGFGGSCLPKDLRAMVHASHDLDVAAPLLASVLPSNDAHIQRVVDMVLEQPRRHVALLGLSFKTGSDDLRESPFVRLAEALLGKGVPLHIFDPDVALGAVFGRNRAYIEERLPHVSRLLGSSMSEVVSPADVVILGKRMNGTQQMLSLVRPDQEVIDLVGAPELPSARRPWVGDSVTPVPA